jgi:predicted lipoprotein
MKQSRDNNSHSVMTHIVKAVTKRIPSGTDEGQEDDELVSIKMDGDDESIFMGRLDGTGEAIDERGSMALRRRDLDGKQMKIIEVGVCVQGTRMLMRVAATEPYAPPEE